MSNFTYDIDLKFHTDTQEAKSKIQELQGSIQNAINTSVTGNLGKGFTTELNAARSSAMELQVALTNAFNVDTGKLNLNKFQTELRNSGMSLKQYAAEMQKLGPAGTEAFAKVAQAISTADTKLFSLTGNMKKLANTLFNTIRWQISATAIQSVTSAISDTVSYAKQLDSSLNNIRIVTGKSANSMAQFAKEANKAAKELSTTTTAYTNASLIYYQQGLSDSEVKKRTDVTIKMANVSKQSAEIVSDQLTAVWNNFYDGSQSLEHYADAMVKLGADTASSSDEIATGLEKFAAIADTVGLSFESASAALATVTAQTRQSADIVGTAFKTIFSRMEQLQQGETLDDGTTLGEYSQALANVGVNIKDAEGNLKDMDTIIEETGKKWQILSNDQKVALSQSVAGIRQYSQFMALMNNYDYYEENLKKAKNANGELDRQNQIYADSVEAAQNKLQASWESIKSELFGGDDLKGLYEFGANMVGIIEKIIKALNGVPGILSLVAVALTRIYSTNIAAFFDRGATAIMNFGSAINNKLHGQGFQSSVSYKQDAISLASKQMANEGDETGVVKSKIMKDEYEIQQLFIANEGKMTESQRQKVQLQQEALKVLGEQVIKQKELTLAAGEEMEKRETILQAELESNRNHQSYSISNTDLTQDTAYDYYNSIIQQAKGYGINTEKEEGVLTDSAFDSELEGQDYIQTLSEAFTNLIEQLNNAISQSQANREQSQIAAVRNENIKLGSAEVYSNSAYDMAKSARDTVNLGSAPISSDTRAEISSNIGEQIEKTSQSLKNVSSISEDVKGDIEGAKQALSEFATGNNESLQVLLELLEKIKTDIAETETAPGNLLATDKAINTLNKIPNENGIDENSTIQEQKNSIISTSTAINAIDPNMLANENMLAEAMQKVNENSEKQYTSFEQLQAKGNELAQNTTKLWTENKKLKTTQASLTAQQKKLEKEGKKNTDEYDKLTKKIAKNKQALTENNEAIVQNAKSVKNYNKAAKKFGTSLKDQSSNGKKATKSTEELGESTLELSEAEVAAANSARQYGKEIATENNIMSTHNKAVNSVKESVAQLGHSFGVSMSGIVSGATQVTMAFNMLTNTFETLGKAFNGAEMDMSDWLSLISTVLMIIPMLSKGITGIGSAIYALGGQESVYNDIKQKGILGSYLHYKALDKESKATLAEAEAEEKAGNIENAKNLKTIGTNLANQASQGLPGLVIAAVCAGVVAAILGAVGISFSISSFKSGKLEQQTENDQAAADAATESATTSASNAQAIKETRETNTELSSLIDNYQQLQAEGENTKETFDSITSSTESLIEKYKELNDSLSQDAKVQIDTTDLEAALEYFELTGDSSILDTATIEANKQAQEAEKEQTTDTIQESKQAIESNIAVIKDKLQAYDINTDIIDNIDWSKFSIDKFQALLAQWKVDGEIPADQDLQDLGVSGVENIWDMLIQASVFNNSEWVEDIEENSNAIVEAYGRIEDAATELADIDPTETLNNIFKSIEIEMPKFTFDPEQEGNILDQVAGYYEKFIEAESEYQGIEINTVKDYAEKRQEIIDILKSQYDFQSDEDAIAWLKTSDLGALETAYSRFEKGTTEYEQLYANGKQDLVNDVREFISDLSGEALTLSLNLDFVGVTNVDQVKDQLNELIKEQNIQESIDEAVAADDEVDETTVSTYAENLQSLSGVYKENEEAAYQAAAANIKLQKGLEGLAEIWEDNIDIVKEGNKASIEYSKALGNLKSKLKDAFGVELSNEFLETARNLEILQEVVEGNLESLGELQIAVAQDYVANMDITLSKDFSLEDAQSARDQMQEMLDSIDTSLEFGDQVTVSDTYYQTLQKMLDAGAITEEQLKDLFSAAGLTITYDYKWVEGPAEAYATYNGNGITLDSIKDGSYKKATQAKYTVKETMVQIPQLTGADGTKSKVLQVNKGATPSTLSGSSIASSGNSSGSDSGSSGSSAESKSYDEEIERNHELNETIEDLERSYDRLTAAKDRAYGKDKLAAIQKVTDSIQEQIDLQDQLIAQNEEYIKNDAAVLRGYGVEFDENGNISNYDEVMQKWVDEYNANKDSDGADEDYQNKLDAMSQYEETHDNLQEAYDKKIDLIYEQLDTELEGIEYKVEFRVEINDRDLTLVEHQLKMIEDRAYNGAQSIALLFKQTEANFNKMSDYKQGITDILTSAGANQNQINSFLSGDASALQGLTFTEQQMEDLMSYSDELLTLTEDLQEIYAQMHEELMETFDEQNEEFDNLSNKVDYLKSKTENYRTIIDLVGKDALGISDDLLDQLNDTTMKAATTSTKVAKERLDTQTKELAIAKSEYQKALARGDEEAISRYESDIKEITEAVQESQLAVQESLKTSLEQAASIFEDTVSRAADAFSEAMGGIAENLSELKETFSMQKKETEQYLTDYKKMYETSKLIRNINKSIDATDNIKYQKELNKLSKQAAEYQQNGKKMSDYDLQYLQKKYDLTLAQQALKDAKDAKDTVRLQRTASGAYGYVYTANQDNISAAEQKVEDAQYAIDELNNSAELTATEQYISLQSELTEKLEAIKRADYDSDEEYQKKLNQLKSHYMTLMNAQYEKILAIMKNTGKSFSDTYLGQMYPDYQNFSDLFQTTSTEIDEMINDMSEAGIEYSENTEDCMEAAGTSLDTYKDTVSKDTDSINKNLDSVDQETEKLSKNSIQHFNDMEWQIGQWEKIYSEKLASACSSNSTLSSSITTLASTYSGKWDEMVTKVQESAKDINDAVSTVTPIPTASAIGSGSSGSGSGGSGTGNSDTGSGDLGVSRQQITLNKGTHLTYVRDNGEQQEVVLSSNSNDWYSYNGDISYGAIVYTSSDSTTPYTISSYDYNFAKNKFLQKYILNKNAYNTTRNLALSNGYAYKNTQGGKWYIAYDNNYGFMTQWVPNTISEKYPLGSVHTQFGDHSSSEATTSTSIENALRNYLKASGYVPGFKNGGLVPYTGPAWVDGTPSSPEAFLNPLQTQLIGNLAEQLQLNANAMRLNYSSSSYDNQLSNNLQQEVTIHAEFPNATNHNEIEEAFSSLINRASQYIGIN